MLLEIPGVLGPSDLIAIRERLALSAFADGRNSAGDMAAEVKRNLELPVGQERVALGNLVANALTSSQEFNQFALPRRILIPIFSRYDVGMSYGLHTDEAVLGMNTPQSALRNDIAITVFLSDPDGYDGGELAVTTPVGRHVFKPPAGHAVVYPSHYLHEVCEVTRGVRLAAVTWLQSYVAAVEQRTVLYDLRVASTRLRDQGAARRETDTIVNTFHKLLRMWTVL
jgi:PKHD-type hydroxylase